MGLNPSPPLPGHKKLRSKFTSAKSTPKPQNLQHHTIQIPNSDTKLSLHGTKPRHTIPQSCRVPKTYCSCLCTTHRTHTNTYRPPDLHYNDTESRKYTTSSRIQRIQADMTHRALDLIGLTQPSLILDVGCGSCLSGEILSQTAEEGTPAGPHVWVGFDISASMLGVALEKEVEGDLLLADAGQGVPFRPGTFDAAISISAIQWLCQAETSEESPAGRLSRFFNQLYASLRRGGRACLQFYPKNDEQKKMVAQAAIKAGFGAGLLEDDPGTKSAKTYLVLTVGGGNLDGDITGVVRGMEGVDVMETRRKAGTMKRGVDKKGSKGWILKKKEQQKAQGKVVKASSKYTGRKRRIQF